LRSRLGAIVLLACLGLTIAVAACGGDDESESESSPNPTVTDTAIGAVELEEGVARLSEGTFNAILAPGAVSGFEPIELPLEAQATPPPCETFQFTFAWLARDNNPAEGLVWRLNESGQLTEIGSGPSGEATIGCGRLEVVNNGGEPFTVDVYYLIGHSTS
jgi:hypothetical protein